MSKRGISVLLFIFGVGIIFYGLNLENEIAAGAKYKINLDTFTYANGENDINLKTYTDNNYKDFLNDFKNNNLPDVYITEFLFDGVDRYKALDLDEFKEKGNKNEFSYLKIKTLNIKNIGFYELNGSFKGMVAINTNSLVGEINLILNNTYIDSDSKKVPAIYVYNKDINYTDCKVNVVLADNSVNHVTGGKFKKISLIGSDELEDYADKYTGDAKTNYSTYVNYYGVYSKNDIDNVLFAKIQADDEDLKDGDPYYYYKGAGAISSDIDLYFTGSGSLEVDSKNKEGIETKGNLILGNGKGDYKITAYDDCLNTTTNSSITNARNQLSINVNTLKAIVDVEADEGDAIDSNGTLIINGGRILALAHPGSDAGIDADKGVYLNGGLLLATGDMYDQISNDSKQNFMVLSTNGSITKNSLITMLDSNNKIVFAYKTDRIYSNLVYSSSYLTNDTYSLYKDGKITGNEENGFYLKVSDYEKGVQLGYENLGNSEPNNLGMNPNDMEKPPVIPNDEDSNTKVKPERIPEEKNEIPNLDINDNKSNNVNKGYIEDNTASNKDFTINNIANLFDGVAIYKEK